MNICVIVAYERPCYLTMCLDYILKAKDSDKWEYLFAVDLGAYQECLDIIDAFPYKKYVVRPAAFKKHKWGRQSFNVLNGLLTATQMNPELVAYIEDDVFIGTDFFTMTADIHAAEPDIFETILSHNVNSIDTLCDDPNAYYVKEDTNVHQGIGNCFKADMLRKYVTPDFCMDYFENPPLYCAKYYPDSKLNNSFSEQDGLIRRIIEKNHLKIAFSHVPRCFHAGIWGYNRTPALNVRRMKTPEKIELIKKYAWNPEELAKVVQAPNLVTDSLPVNLETSHSDCYKNNL